jgi:hypothetical protein
MIDKDLPLNGLQENLAKDLVYLEENQDLTPEELAKITHTYSQPGIYPVLLTTTWNGSFSHNAVERAITGQIKKVSALTITVVAAPTRFMN